jgi:hypothetical protein
VSTLAQIAASYGVRYVDLASLVGINGVDPNAELNERKTAMIVGQIEASGSFGSSHGRHRF